MLQFLPSNPDMSLSYNTYNSIMYLTALIFVWVYVKYHYYKFVLTYTVL